MKKVNESQLNEILESLRPAELIKIAGGRTYMSMFANKADTITIIVKPDLDDELGQIKTTIQTQIKSNVVQDLLDIHDELGIAIEFANKVKNRGLFPIDTDY